MNERDRFHHLAELLDRFAGMPTATLVHVVSRRGRCLELLYAGDAPVVTGDAVTDQDTATGVCSACPVQHECLELNLRWPGAQPGGVFGAVSGEDRRALVPVWRARRKGGGRR